jgi:hypothetical protein
VQAVLDRLLRRWDTRAVRRAFRGWYVDMDSERQRRAEENLSLAIHFRSTHDKLVKVGGSTRRDTEYSDEVDAERSCTSGLLWVH